VDSAATFGTKLKQRVSRVTWNSPRQHAASAAVIELVTTRNSRRMLVGGFRVVWDDLYFKSLVIFLEELDKRASNQVVISDRHGLNFTLPPNFEYS
jgi:hypothetical protein